MQSEEATGTTKHVQLMPPCNYIHHSTVLCCYNQVIVVVTSTFCTETSETVPNMCVVVDSDAVSSDFVKRFDCIISQYNL